MVTVKKVKDVLDEMKTIYDYKDENSHFNLEDDAIRFGRCVVAVATVDEETGIKVEMRKSAVGGADELS